MDTYEKKYKEAQKWIESIYSELSHEQQMEAEAFFPELAESKDERIRQEIIETFKNLGDGKMPVDINYADIFTWLEKQGEQKPAWSEEDEIKLNRIVTAMEALNVEQYDLLCKDMNWLKSLKQRIGWKPSDEQMRALHDLNLTGNISYAGQGQVLIELYNGLKKLTE